MLTSLKRWLKRILFPSYFADKHLKNFSHTEFSEADIIQLFFTYYSGKGVMIDVGAHYGGSFKPYESLGWKIYAFEPDPNNSKHIGKMSARTELSNVAISDSDDKEMTLYTSDESSGISSLSPFRESHKASVKVKTKTLKTFCKEKQISEIDFFKIDTEGFDLFVLKGFPFDKLKPKVILCEFEDSKTLQLGYSYADMGNYLVNQGYEVLISEWDPIVKYGISHTWRKINKFPDTMIENKNGWGNFIAVRPDCIDEFKKVKERYLHYLKINTEKAK